MAFARWSVRSKKRSIRSASTTTNPRPHPLSKESAMSNRFYAVMICGLLASTAHAEPFAATATSGPEAWKKYDVRGIELGQSREALVKKGFTCGKRANSRCYKIMDKRCDKGRCALKEDAFGQWFELNGTKTELDYMSCATTETDGALIYDIRLVFGPRQLLSPDSTLGKALVGKYGGATHVEEAQKEDKVGG